MSRQHQAASEAVAAKFPEAFDSQAIALAFATLKARADGDETKVRLRFDKVVVWLTNHLQTALSESVPTGMTVLLTVTAPIRLASKTGAALEENILALLERGSPARDRQETIHGNRVRIRLLRHESAQPPKLIVFVHNPDADSLLLLNMTAELLRLVTGGAATSTTRSATRAPRERWLVLSSAAPRSSLQAYRYICSQLPFAAAFQKIVMVFPGGHVEDLSH